MNLRYRAYAKARGLTTAQMMKHDRGAFPGGCMTGFILWIGERWREWERETEWSGEFKTEDDHRAFNNWLERPRSQL